MGSAHIPGHRGQVVPVVIAWAGDVVDLRACFALGVQAGLRPKVHIFVFELNRNSHKNLQEIVQTTEPVSLVHWLSLVVRTSKVPWVL